MCGPVKVVSGAKVPLQKLVLKLHRTNGKDAVVLSYKNASSVLATATLEHVSVVTLHLNLQIRFTRMKDEPNSGLLHWR